MKKKGNLQNTIPFRNSKGDILHIPVDYKINDLLRMGVTEIRIVKKGSFLPDGWYVDMGIESKTAISPKTKTKNKTRKEKHERSRRSSKRS